MKKLAVSIFVALALSMAAVAQTATDPSQGNSGAAPSAAQPSEQQPAPATNPAGQPTSSDTASTDKADKKLHGCVQSQGGQYVLESKKGKAIALTGQDVSAHVGHEVSLKGTWESAGAGTGVSTASGDKTFNVASVTMISDTCGGKSSKGDSGSMGTSPSSPNSEGTGSTSNPPPQ
jgi:hypothetical protein